MRDLGLTQAVAPVVPEPFVPLLIVLTAFGGPKIVAFVSTTGALSGVATDRIEWPRARRFLVAVALALSASILLKHGFAMSRPPESLMAIPEDGYGFPSGHATAAAGLATALVGVSRTTGPWSYLLGVTYVALIGSTRILLGVHYLVDVLVGIGVGVLVATLGLRADRHNPRVAVLATVGTVMLALLIWVFL